MLSHHDSKKGITPSNKDKQVKKSTQRDKRRYAEQLAEEAEAEAVYKITGKLRGDHNTNQDIPVKASDGTNITAEMLKAEEQVTPEILSKAYGKVSPSQMNGEQD